MSVLEMNQFLGRQSLIGTILIMWYHIHLKYG